MKRKKQTLYENIATDAVMYTVKDMYGTKKRLSEGMLNEGFGGGVWGILLFFLALFGISSGGLRSLINPSNNTAQDQQQTTATTNQEQTQQTTQSTQQTGNDNNANLEKLAKEKGLVDIVDKFGGRNLKYDPQYAKSLSQYGGVVFYSQPPKAYACSTVIANLDKVLKTLQKQNLGLLIYDAARPESVQKQLASAAKECDKKNGKKYDSRFISEKGGKHTQGKAIDCTLYNTKNNTVIDMGGEFDERSDRSVTNYYAKKNSTIHKNRMILHDAMKSAGMKNYSQEWWHYYV